MICICGNSIEELERDLEVIKNAIDNGATCGIGGNSLDEVEIAINMLNEVLG